MDVARDARTTAREDGGMAMIAGIILAFAEVASVAIFLAALVLIGGVLCGRI
jgi:hypothetical protein